jgi:hypothetical protein
LCPLEFKLDCPVVITAGLAGLAHKQGSEDRGAQIVPELIPKLQRALAKAEATLASNVQVTSCFHWGAGFELPPPQKGFVLLARAPARFRS